jgi:transcriptional regulator with XRE-family HTH domain
MDELNKRVLSIMEKQQMSKSTFATVLEISLPVLTHISSGRNKPGLELIQKLLIKFPNINPDWLILGEGNMYRVKENKPDFSTEMQEIESIIQYLEAVEKRTDKVLEYHKIVHREISYLNDLDKLLYENQSITLGLKEKIVEINHKIKSKLVD